MFDHQPAPRFLAATILLALAACAAPSRPGAGVGPGPTRPEAASPAGSYQVVAADIVVKVYRDGPLARLGHNHVVSATVVTGQVALRDPLTASSFSLSLPVAGFVVDDPARRAAAGADFPDDLTAADKDGTRRNLLGPALLDAARFPVLHLDSVAIAADAGGYLVTARVDAAGHERQIQIPARLERHGGELVVSGEFVLTHAELGLTPFTAALGALRVGEDMEVAYRLLAREDAA